MIKNFFCGILFIALVTTAKAQVETSTWYLVDSTGKQISKNGYEELRMLMNGMLAFKSNEKWGFMDKNENVIIEPIYKELVDIFRGDYAVVNKEGKYKEVEFIDKKGNIAFGQKFWGAKSFTEGLAPAAIGLYKWGFINTEGKMVIEPTFKEVDYFYEGFARAKKDDEWGLIDKKGNWVIKPNYSGLYRVSNGLVQFEKKNKYGFMNTEGKVIIDNDYEDATYFANGVAAVKKKGLYGVIDKTGKEIIPFKYTMLGSFNEGLAAAEINGKLCFIDLADKVVIQTDYKNGTNPTFNNGQAQVHNFRNGLLYHGFVNKKGTLVLPVIYTNVYDFYEGYSVVSVKDQPIDYAIFQNIDVKFCLNELSSDTKKVKEYTDEAMSKFDRLNTFLEQGKKDVVFEKNDVVGSVEKLEYYFESLNEKLNGFWCDKIDVSTKNQLRGIFKQQERDIKAFKNAVKNIVVKRGVTGRDKLSTAFRAIGLTFSGY